MGTLLQDIVYSLRALRRSPGFAAVVVLTLALGIGANTAIFSIVDAVLLRPLPFHDAHQLVRIVHSAGGLGLHDIGFSVPEMDDLAARSGAFERVSPTWPVDGNLTGSDAPERVELLAVSADYFDLLGAHAQLGRTFGPEDRQPGFAEAVVISDSMWHRRFGGAHSVLGKQLRVDNDLYTIVGVMPPNFRHPGRTVATEVDLWGTAGFTALPFPPAQRSVRLLPGAIGRLKTGETLQSAQSRLDALQASLNREFPNDYKPGAQWTLQLEPLQRTVVGNVGPLLWVLLGAVALMLVTGCVNIANLLLARASGRTREVAIRQALGAMRGRLIRQFLTESVLLSFLAGIVGIGAAAAAMRALLSFIPSKLPRLNEIALDTRVLFFALAVSLLTGILFGLAPALTASSTALTESLRESSRGGGRSQRQNRISSALVVAEFAVCMILMIGAGLLVRSFWNLIDLDPGFRPQNLLVARIWLPVPNDPKTDTYATLDQRVNFSREVLRRVRELPGVTNAAMTSSVPLTGTLNPFPFSIEDRPAVTGDALQAETVSVTPEYFTTLGTPLLRGRFLQDTDQKDTQTVVLIDQSTARRYWPNESPLGKRLKPGPAQSRVPWFTVIGVVGDIRHDGIDVDGIPHLYFSVNQRVGKVLGVTARSSGDPSSLVEPLRRAIQSVDPNLPVFGIRTMDDMVTSSLAQHRFSAQLMAAFAVLAMLLGAVGIYGVLAYSIGQRTREIGIRMALGARRAEVIRMVLWQGMRLILIGVVAGAIGAIALSRLMSGLVYGVSLTDPLVFLSVTTVLLLSALLASYLPAYRATRIDPLEALRCD